MEGVRTFLESSTIHGLGYISTTKRLVRLFWILVVIGGFTAAGYLIYESVQDWSDNPVKTTVETVPISEITFPKVTVCPPQNTFTDLNYDLMMTENITLDKDTIDELSNLAGALLYEQLADNLVANISKLDDSKRYYNWYHGYSKIRAPVFDDNEIMGTGLDYKMFTSATSGTITTPHFGEKFDAVKVEKRLDFHITISPPQNVLTNSDTTLHLEIEKISLKDLPEIHKDEMSSGKTGDSNYLAYLQDKIKTDQTLVVKDLTPPEEIYIQLQRRVDLKDLNTQNLEVMPGFKVTWRYSNTVKPQAKFSNEDFTKAFVRYFFSYLLISYVLLLYLILLKINYMYRLANLLMISSVENIWHAVRKVKLETANDKDCLWGLYSESDDVTDQVKAVEEALNFESSESTFDTLTPEDLKIAADMFIYLNLCPSSESVQIWLRTMSTFFDDLFKKKPANEIILTLNRMMKTKYDTDGNIFAQKIFKRTSSLLALKYEEIQSLLPGGGTNTSVGSSQAIKNLGKNTILYNIRNKYRVSRKKTHFAYCKAQARTGKGWPLR